MLLTSGAVLDGFSQFPAWVPSWMPVLVIVWLGLYLLVFLIMNAGVARLVRSTTLPDAACPTVSVVVSARNEERDLPACIASLVALDYPHDRLQIILVDDFSTDRTTLLVDEAARQHAAISALHSRELPDNGLEAKARGIAHGISIATGEWLFVTDADGTVHSQWLRALLSRAGPETGMVGGTLLVQNTGTLGQMERMAWGFLQTFSAGLAGWGLPIVCVGPNMGMRRALYVAAGGLERAKFRVAEDLALFGMVVRVGKRVQMYMDHETTVTLAPVPSPSHLLSQHRRWLGGGVEQNPWYKGLVLLALWWGFGVNAFVLLGWLLNWPLWLGFIIAKVAVDWSTLRLQQHRLRVAQHARFIGILEVYHIIFLSILPPIFLVNQGIEWRGEGYSVRYS
ncbi:MAG: glycosyltransferase [Phycisphaerae bacterium]|nr:glycosyltransferase [Gemmatimonadaceae bacterium]